MVDSPGDGPVPVEEEPPGGIFRSWTAVYASVAVVTVLMIVLLYWFTVALDFSTP